MASKRSYVAFHSVKTIWSYGISIFSQSFSGAFRCCFMPYGLRFFALFKMATVFVKSSPILSALPRGRSVLHAHAVVLPP